MIYDFLKEHWEIVRWVALGAVVLEVMVPFAFVEELRVS